MNCPGAAWRACKNKRQAGSLLSGAGKSQSRWQLKNRTITPLVSEERSRSLVKELGRAQQNGDERLIREPVLERSGEVGQVLGKGLAA